MNAESGGDIGLTLNEPPKTPKLASREIILYKSYLKSKYLEKKIPDYGKWPKSTSNKFINLAIIPKQCDISQEEKSKALIYGDVWKINHKGNIRFEDLAIRSEEGVLPKFVLVEGAPGVGKSTFAWEACRKWANGEILQEYELVILIRLRDESIRKAKCLGDLIQYPRDTSIREMVVDEVIKTGGLGVLLLLEGYDELPSSLQAKESLFRQVINGYQFCEGTVLVTSRHWASEPFLLPNYTTERPVSQHIEIFGFTRENIHEYLSDMLKDEPSLFADLHQYLEAYPHIHSMMYIPLNCAIVLEVYRKSKRQSLPFPTTMTELYYSLICCLLLRHIGDLPEYKDKCIKLDSISELPQPLDMHFGILAKLAYEGICNRNQQIIFTEEDIEPKTTNLVPNQTLGLMQTSLELHCATGAKKSFNFLHLTIQEFLAAYHILTFTKDDQIKWFRDHTNADNRFAYTHKETVLRFLAGLSREAFETVLADVPVLYLKEEMIHRLFEAKLGLFNKHVTVNYGITMWVHTYILYMLGSIIANSSHTCHWDVHITGTDDSMQMLVCGISNKNVESNLTLHIHVDIDEGLHLNPSLSQLNCTLEHLHLIGKGLQLTRDGKDSTTASYFLNDEPFSDIFLSKDSELHIKYLQLTSLKFDVTESKKIESYLKNTPSIKGLTLEYCVFSRMSHDIHVLPGVEACNNLEKLCIHTSHDTDDDSSQCSWDNVHQMLRDNKSLKELEVSCDIDVLSNLPECLCTNTTIRKLVITAYEFGPSSQGYFDEDLNVHEDQWSPKTIWDKDDRMGISQWLNLTKKLAKMIKENKTLTELKVNHRSEYKEEHVYKSSPIAKAMCENDTLQKLSILDYDYSLNFASMLKENTTLKEFSCKVQDQHYVPDDKWISDFIIFTSSLAHNKSLSKLQVYYGRLSQKCHEAMETECAKDHRLVCYSLYDT